MNFAQYFVQHYEKQFVAQICEVQCTTFVQNFTCIALGETLSSILSNVNNIVPIIVQHCITLGETYFVSNVVANLVCNVCTKDRLHT